MAETLKIENFGPIKKASLKLGKTTIFIGEQSSGKSTIAKLIAIFRDYELLHVFNPVLKENLDNLLLSIFKKYQITNYFKSESALVYENDYYRLSYSEGKFKLNLVGEYRNRIMYLTMLYEEGRLLQSNEYKEWETKVRENVTSDSPIRLSLNTENSDRKSELFIAYNSRAAVKHSFYIPAERILIATLVKSIFTLMTGNIALPSSLIDFASKYQLASNKTPQLDIPFLGLKFVSLQGTDKVIDTNGVELDISEASSGIQSVVPLILAITGNKRDDHTLPLYTTYVIEEPELSLFPTTQLKLINFLTDNCSQEGNELVITTHSPYVLTALNNLLFAFRTATKKPEQKNEIDEIIPESSWLNPNDFAAYYVGHGTVEDIHDKKTGLIGDNHLDDASDEVGDAFNALMEIYRD